MISPASFNYYLELLAELEHSTDLRRNLHILEIMMFDMPDYFLPDTTTC